MGARAVVRMSGPNLTPPAVIAVLGAGNMGSGIAQACAQAGYTVWLRDLDEPMLARGRGLIEKTLEGAIQRKKITAAKRDELLARVHYTTEVATAVREAELVIEAIFEEESKKRELFAEVARHVPAGSIVATNTSSLSVSRLSEGFPNPGRFAGLHFFYPAAINKLLEVIGGTQTSPETVRALERFGYQLRKTPIEVHDAAGFAVNRFFVPYLNEATRLAEEHVASMATIEEVGRELFGTTLGPFELMNVTGVTIAFHSETSLSNAFGRAYAPSALLEAQFRRATPWPWKESAVEPDRKGAVRERLLGLVLGIATELVEEGVASPEATDRGATVGLRWRNGPFALLSAVGLPEGLRLVEGYAARWGDSFPVSAGLRSRVARGETTWPMRWVRVERRGPVAWVLLDRPEVLNSLNSELLAQLDRAIEALNQDREVRAVVLAGSSPVFAAGADIAEMARKSVAEGRAFGFAGQAVCKRIETSRMPVIALVEGYALGGGLELALSADFILAAEGAQLGLPETTVGIHTGFGGASRLTRLIGRAKTKMLLFTGVPVPAAEAARLGFVVRVLPAATARDDAQALAETIASRAPLAVSWAKAVVDHGMDSPLDAAMRLEGESAAHTFGTADRTEGMQAFLERRPPKFRGD
ncbi:MAG: enoyl-CoA hydratase-related protein [Thermoplasmata archaeon]|nr:enoyl-CoA hydratase-related protein [Thermoplasmata archaeon]